MPPTITPDLSGPEQTVVDRASELANTRVVNLHEVLLSEHLAPWFIVAPPTVREALRSSFKRSHDTQRAVTAVLAQLKPVEVFAEPLLKTALTFHGWSEVNPRTHGLKHVRLLSNLLLFFAQQQVTLADTLVQLVVPDILTPETLELDLVSSITHHSLLQAALQNFEAAETAAGGFDRGTAIYSVNGTQRVEQPELKPERFAQICRDLNLGEQYQWHLNNVFEPADDNLAPENARSKAYQLKRVFSQNLRHEFEVALHMAYLKQEINSTNYGFIVNLLSASTARLAGMQSVHSTFHIMGFEVPGVIILWPENKPVNQAQSCVLYFPRSPHKAFHHFESFDLFKATLRVWLKDAVFTRYFFQLVPLRYRAEFMRRTDAKNMAWDSLLLRRSPIINEPALMSESRHILQSEDPFDVAWRLQLAQIKDDARLLIVPTQDEDSKSRLARQASFLNLGLSVMALALGFVPVLGEILLLTSVIQLGVDVYEGIEAWQRDDRAAALEHLFDLAQNIALAGSASAAARVLKPSPFVDALVPVRAVSGQQRLWKPDLTPYEFKKVSLTGLKPDAQGLYRVSGKQFVRLQDKVFCVTTDTDAQTGFIQHPDDPQAYTPRLKHNGNGAWRHELETPMQWSRMQLLRRLGPDAQAFSDTTLEHILASTDTREQVLRELHMDNRPPPGLLADSIKRVRLSETIERFIVQMKQAVDLTVENATLQLELLPQLPGWPLDRVLRVVDMDGVTLKEYGRQLQALHPRLQIAEVQVKNGDLLKVTLECLSSAQIEQLLGEPVSGLRQQVQGLSRKLGKHAHENKSELLTRLYALDDVLTPQMTALQKQFPGLPVTVMKELLGHHATTQASTLGGTGRLPLHVLEEARGYAQVLRLNRSLEGLYFEALNSADSNRLALHTLARLPGWADTMGMVLRDKTSGAVLDTVGNDSAAGSREIFKHGSLYEVAGAGVEGAYTSPYLLKCVARALSPYERSVLGLPVVEPSVVLSRKIADLAAQQRAQSAEVLGMQHIKPWFKSPLRLADGRLGYTLGGRSGHMAQESRTLLLKDLVAQLFPTMDETQAGQFLYRLNLSPVLTARALSRLKAELDTLRNDLDQWVSRPVWSQLSNGPQVLVSVEHKRAISQVLLRAWRRQTESVHFDGHTGYVLNLNAWPVDALPELSADFGHISSLRLNYSPNGKFPRGFLEKFRNLRVLSLTHSHLRALPPELSAMPELIELDLRGNQIVLNSQGSALLSALTKLKSLNLNGNNLGRRISIRRMANLQHLRLRDTGIQTWPEGVEALSHLQNLDLRDNDISRIPQEVLTASRAEINRVTYLHDNPLSVDSLRRLEIYRREQGIDLGIDPLRRHVVQAQGIFHWSTQPTFEQSTVWSDLKGTDGSADFFRVIEDLSASSQYLHGRENLSQRVWAIFKAMHENSALRDQLFDVSANPDTCADGIPMIFADMELRHQIFIAQSTENSEDKLLKLAHGLFRIELLDKHVQGVIDARIAAIHAAQRENIEQLQRLIDAAGPDYAARPLADMTPEEQQNIAYRLGTAQALRLAQRLSPADLQARIERVEPLEVQMFYQVKLAQELGLPARPKNMIFERMARVTPEQLETARQHVLSEDNPAAKLAYIEKLGFWGTFLQRKYPDEFQAVDAPLHERMQVLFIARESMSSQDYVVQSHAIGESRELTRAELIARLTRKEIDEHPLAQL